MPGFSTASEATTHWYLLEELRDEHPAIRYVADRRFVVDQGVATTTGITASMPMALTLIEAIAGRAKAQAVSRDLGLMSWDARHDSEAFKFTRPFALTAIGNMLAFWNREQLGIELAPGVDEVSLALVADALSRTYRSRAVTFSGTDGRWKAAMASVFFPIRSPRAGLRSVFCRRLGASRRQRHWTKPFRRSRPATEYALPTSSPCSSNTQGRARGNEDRR